MSAVAHISGQTFHGRRGDIANAFRYSVDYLLLDAETEPRGPGLFRRNRRGIFTLNDTDHGGAPGTGRGATWVRDILERYQISGVTKIELLAQPKVLGHVFNPVSFWLCRRAQDLIAVIAEVTNTFGERHCYLVRHGDQRPIRREDRLEAEKIFYVSPFQPIAGGYTFRFDITSERLGIWIDYGYESGGVLATLSGRVAPLTNVGILRSLIRRPFGSRRVLALIHWQALKLWWKGARYKTRPAPPTEEVSS